MSSTIRASQTKARATVSRNVAAVVRPLSGLTRTSESGMEQQAQALARASRHDADGANHGSNRAAGGRAAAPVAHFAAQHGYDLGRIRIHTGAGPVDERTLQIVAARFCCLIAGVDADVSDAFRLPGSGCDQW